MLKSFLTLAINLAGAERFTAVVHMCGLHLCFT
jgi:hypothetical protein